MSFIYANLSGLETIDSGQLLSGQRLTLITAAGMVNITYAALQQAMTQPLSDRLEILSDRLEILEDDGVSGATGPTVWPLARTISLAGAVSGTVAVDGSQNVTMATTIADGSLTVAKVANLTTMLDTLGAATNKRWGTGYTQGNGPTSYGGDLNALSGATYLFTQALTTNTPDTTTPAGFVILQNGPINSGNQIALRDGALWTRGQAFGAWGRWNLQWSTGNLDPGNLLYKGDTASVATKLETGQNFSLTGVITASPKSFNGSRSLTLATSIADSALSVAMTSGLQDALDTRPAVKGSVVDGTNLNSVKANGYYFRTTNDPTGIPTTLNYPITAPGACTLTVLTIGSLTRQELTTVSNARSWVRSCVDNAWTAWVLTADGAALTTALDTKVDKSGASFTGPVRFNGGAVGGIGALSTNTVEILGSADIPAEMSLSGRGGRGYSKLSHDATETRLERTPVYNTTFALRMNDQGTLSYNSNEVWDAGNFDPTVPVPVGGLLTVGPKTGTNLQFRFDGKYSVDGRTWHSINEALTADPNPKFTTVSFGLDTDIQFYETSADSGSLSLRTGSSVSYKNFSFGSTGDFAVSDGRVLIEGHEAWHAGNFDPTTKADVTATAPKATQLAYARTINGIAFDGSKNIVVPAMLDTVVTTDITVRQASGVYQSDDASATRGWPAGSSGSWLLWSMTNKNTDTYNALQLAALESDVNTAAIRVTNNDGTASWQQLWHAGTLDPTSLAPKVDPYFTGVLNHTGTVGLTGALSIATADGTGLVEMRSTVAGIDFYNAKNLTSAQLTGSGNIWTASDFNPLTKLDKRSSLLSGGEEVTNWNDCTANGWYWSIAGTAVNAPAAFDYTGLVSTLNGSVLQELQATTAPYLRYWLLKHTATSLWTAWSTDRTMGALTSTKISVGYDAGVEGTIGCNNWFRSQGTTGLLFSDFGSGLYMTDSTYVRTYNDKGLAASDFVLTSDPRLRENQRDFEYRGRLRPVNFTMIDTGKEDFGFLADEVQVNYPEAVGSILKDSGYLKDEPILQLSQGKLLAVVSYQVNRAEDNLVTLQDELRSELTDLRSELAQLKQLVADLRNQ